MKSRNFANEAWSSALACCACLSSQSCAASKRFQPGKVAGIYLTPFRMTGRLLEFCDLRKEGVYKPLHPPVAVDVGLRPVIGNENGAHSDRIHLAGRNELG